MSVTETRPSAADPGIRPVPSEQRALGTLDVAILWGDLGIGLLVLVFLAGFGVRREETASPAVRR